MNIPASALLRVLLISSFILSPSIRAADAAAVKKLFARPTRDFSSGPLWVWNDMLTEKQIRDTMRDLAGQQVKQVFVHPRPGLMTPYLSKDWFRLWKVALDEAERLDMNVWIYDENSYPSGFAGGWVPELMPESCGRGLFFRDVKSAPKWDDKTVAVFRISDSRAEDVSKQVKSGEALADGSFLVAEIRRAANSPWNADRCYVDLLYPGVTEKFLEVTHEAYRREIGKQFGKRIPGSFTDEPELRPAGGMAWTEDLPQHFQKGWGYSLIENLASLARPVGDWQRVRHNYYDTLNELFVERWAKPYGAYCEKHHLEMTGHYWEHEWPKAGAVPDNMSMYAWQQRPAIDCLMNQYAENTHAQFGNARAVRELGSIANQLGKKRTLCEVYGAGGWDIRFEDMKRIADWLGVLGVNTFDQHLSYVTIRGARKRDHPQSFSYHEPWWDSYHVSATYLGRLAVAASQGEQVNRILVIEPTTTAWMYQGDAGKLGAVGDSFFKLVMSLEVAQVEYDIGSEDVIARHGSIDGKGFRVGQRNYSVVVLPPLNENVNAATAKLLQEFSRAGGSIVTCGEPPSRVDGVTSSALQALSATRTTGAELPRVLTKWADPSFSIIRATDDHGILFHMRRQLSDGELLLLVNTSIEASSAGDIKSMARGLERWDLSTGEIASYAFRSDSSGVRAKFNLPPNGSLLLFLSKAPVSQAPALTESTLRVAALAPVEARRLEPNVLTLDYVDVTAGGETKRDIYFYQANQFVWQKNGLPRNPWDSAVQFKDELISRKFPPGSGFEASYKFTIEGAVPPNLAIVIERADLYDVTCNGKPVSAKRDDWWLDKAFGRIPIVKTARVGENIVTIQASPFTMFHELESAYVLGDFTLKPADKGFVIAADEPLRVFGTEPTLTHGINPDGTMWLSGGIDYQGTDEDRAPFIIFDLGRTTDVASVKIWNYNEAHVRDLTFRGAESIRISASSDPDHASFHPVADTVHLKPGNGRAATADELNLKTGRVRYVRFDMLRNFENVSFPARGEVPDNGLVGLAEVQFIDGDGRKIEGVRVARCSSELAKHRRFARHLLDGSGLDDRSGLGWNAQGHPFYSAGVAYRQKFNLGDTNGRYSVHLPSWYGSVAKVLVNGRLAGHIAAPPWDCDVTSALKRGENTIDVIVIGTLKNTLGPHHGNPVLGSAWPGMFQKGPNPGPPPGAQYSTVSYGLFAPFELKRIETGTQTARH